MDPDERSNGSLNPRLAPPFTNSESSRGTNLVDVRTGEISARGSNDASNQQTKHDSSGLHDGRPESLANNDGDKDRESQTQELGRTPRQGVGSIDAGAHGKKPLGVVNAGSRPAGPALEASLDEMDTDEHDGRTSDDRGEQFAKHLGREERECDFYKGADAGGSEDCSISIRAWELGNTVFCHRTWNPSVLKLLGLGFGRVRIQNPFLYHCANAPWATGMTVKDVPTTEIKPVPRK